MLYRGNPSLIDGIHFLVGGISFTPGELLGCVSGGLGLRKPRWSFGEPASIQWHGTIFLHNRLTTPVALCLDLFFPPLLAHCAPLHLLAYHLPPQHPVGIRDKCGWPGVEVS
eukprot:gene7456-6982_t